MNRLGRRSIIAAPLLLACKRHPKIDPDIAAWLGEPGDPPTPKLFAKLSQRSTRADVIAAFPGSEPWGGNSARVRTSAAPGLEWLEFQFPSSTLYNVTVVYAAAASTPDLWSKLVAALSARYGAAKNPGGSLVMFAAKGFAGISAYEKDAMAGHRVKFFFPF